MTVEINLEIMAVEEEKISNSYRGLMFQKLL